MNWLTSLLFELSPILVIPPIFKIDAQKTQIDNKVPKLGTYKQGSQSYYNYHFQRQTNTWVDENHCYLSLAFFLWFTDLHCRFTKQCKWIARWFSLDHMKIRLVILLLSPLRTMERLSWWKSRLSELRCIFELLSICNIDSQNNTNR